MSPRARPYSAIVSRVANIWGKECPVTRGIEYDSPRDLDSGEDILPRMTHIPNQAFRYEDRSLKGKRQAYQTIAQTSHSVGSLSASEIAEEPRSR